MCQRGDDERRGRGVREEEVKALPLPFMTSPPSHRWVAHFAHPLELELLSRGAVPANRYPVLQMQASGGAAAAGKGGMGSG